MAVFEDCQAATVTTKPPQLFFYPFNYFEFNYLGHIFKVAKLDRQSQSQTQKIKILESVATWTFLILRNKIFLQWFQQNLFS